MGALAMAPDKLDSDRSRLRLLSMSRASCAQGKCRPPGGSMMIAAIAYLACAAVFLELCARAPTLDEPETP